MVQTAQVEEAYDDIKCIHSGHDDEAKNKVSITETLPTYAYKWKAKNLLAFLRVLVYLTKNNRHISGKVDIPTLYKLMSTQEISSHLYGDHFELHFEDVIDIYTNCTPQLAVQHLADKNNTDNTKHNEEHPDALPQQQDSPKPSFHGFLTPPRNDEFTLTAQRFIHS